MMKARAMNPKALAAATMMALTMVATSGAQAAPAAAPAVDGMSSRWMAPAAQMRTLMNYADGAWMAPAAVVLKSAKDWNDWNDDMVAQGKAVGREAMPNVNWATEVVLVVTLGATENAAALELKNPRRMGLKTEVELAVRYGQGGAAPAYVVAMDKRMAKSVRLVNAEAVGLSAQVPAYDSRPAVMQANAANAALATSWVELKDAYRNLVFSAAKPRNTSPPYTGERARRDNAAGSSLSGSNGAPGPSASHSLSRRVARQSSALYSTAFSSSARSPDLSQVEYQNIDCAALASGWLQRKPSRFATALSEYE
jgi:hypothetical protein